MENHNKGTFKGSFGFVMAAAGSAVGLGNIWRFPYLAARDGGGLFLVVYIVLTLTFGFSMLITEIAIGRKTRQSPLTAYRALSKKGGWIGILSCIVPFLIFPYYCIVGGWVIKFFIVFLTGRGLDATADGYFKGFISGMSEPLIFFIIFLILCAAVIFRGVSGGIERISKILMPVLILLVIGIAIYSLTLKSTDASGNTITGLDGLKIYLIPDMSGVSFRQFFRILIDATVQLFFSLSIAVGNMIIYGAYVPDRTNLPRAVNQIEIFDLLIAFLAGVMIIPAVVVFMGVEGLDAGPSMMFVSMPKVFAAMGTAGHIVGAVFFAMVFFAALTSGIAVMETIIASFMDRFHMIRKKAVVIESVLAVVMGIIVCFGYNVFYFEARLPNSPSPGQILDILEFISNYILMPVIGLATCILIGWALKPDSVVDEMTKNGERFPRKKMYRIMIRYISPVFLIVILLFSFGIF